MRNRRSLGVQGRAVSMESGLEDRNNDEATAASPYATKSQWSPA